MIQFSPTRRVAAPVRTAIVASAIAIIALPSFAQAPPERLADQDVKALIEQVDTGRDKFEGNLDTLQDYQDSTQKLKARFTSDYSAGPEAATVLKQSTAIDAFMRRQAGTMKGRSEWDSQAATITRLAAAYGATFPLPDGATVRRMNDKEAAAAAAGIATAADRLKHDLDKLPKPDKEAGAKTVDLLIKQANQAKSRIADGQPATSEVRQVVQQVGALQAFVTTHPLPMMTNWQAVQASLAQLQQAFGLTP
jgi:hypothetical protein